MKWAVLACLLLAGCASSHQLILADGSKGYLIQCGAANAMETGGMGECQKKSGETCPNGYKLLVADHDSATMSMTIQCAPAKP